MASSVNQDNIKEVTDALVMHDSDEVPEIPKSMRQLEVLISAGSPSPQGHYSTQ